MIRLKIIMCNHNSNHYFLEAKKLNLILICLREFCKGMNIRRKMKQRMLMKMIMNMIWIMIMKGKKREKEKEVMMRMRMRMGMMIEK